MAGHVSWRAGGSAARAYFPADLADLAEFLRRLRPDEPLLCVGLGSNLLVRDGGFDGTLVFSHGALNALRREPDGTLYVEAGVGALAMNAGCHGGETWPLVDRVLMLNRRGQPIERRPDEFAIGYRHVGLRRMTDEIFAAAWLRLAEGDGGAARARIAELLDKRLASQPLDLPNAGSVFRNPPGDHAARLIEVAGLKGLAAGAARVSEKHANFIVNPGGAASAGEIESLIGRVQAEVRQRFGVELLREVRIVGEQA